MGPKPCSGQAEFRLPCSRLFNQESPSVSYSLTLETPQCHLYTEVNGPGEGPTNSRKLVTGCPPRQGGPDSRLPAAAYAELLSPKLSALTRAFSGDFQFTGLVWLQLGRPDSTHNLPKSLPIFLRSGKKLGGTRGHQERKKTYSNTEV